MQFKVLIFVLIVILIKVLMNFGISIPFIGTFMNITFAIIVYMKLEGKIKSIILKILITLLSVGLLFLIWKLIYNILPMRLSLFINSIILAIILYNLLNLKIEKFFVKLIICFIFEFLILLVFSNFLETNAEDTTIVKNILRYILIYLSLFYMIILSLKNVNYNLNILTIIILDVVITVIFMIALINIDIEKSKCDKLAKLLVNDIKISNFNTMIGTIKTDMSNEFGTNSYGGFNLMYADIDDSYIIMDLVFKSTVQGVDFINNIDERELSKDKQSIIQIIASAIVMANNLTIEADNIIGLYIADYVLSILLIFSTGVFLHFSKNNNLISVT